MSPLHSGRIPNKREQKQMWLPHPYLLGGPKEGGNATSPLHCGRILYKGDLNQNWLPHPCLLGGPKEGGNAVSPLPSRESSTKGTKIRSGCLCFGPKQGGNATSPLHSQGSSANGTKIRRGCLTPALSGAHTRAECDVCPVLQGTPNKGDQNQKWLPHPYLLGGPKEGGNATSLLNSGGSATNRCRFASGCLTPALSGAQQRAEMLRHACILGDPQQTGPKSEEDASPWTSRVPKRGRKCFVTPTFLGILNKWDQNQKRMPHPCFLGGPHEGGNATSPLHSGGSPTKGCNIRSGCLTRALSKAQKRAEMLRHPYILGDPQQTGPKSEVAASPLPWRGPKRGRKCYVTPDARGSPTKGCTIRSGCLTPALSRAQKRAEMLRHPRILGDRERTSPKSKEDASPLPSWGPHKGGNATSPLHSRGSPTKGYKIRRGCLTLAFLGPTPGQICDVTPAFSGTPNKGDQNQKWLPHPCLVGGPKEGANATSPEHSWGSPTKGTKIRSGYLPPTFPGAQKRRKCYVTPALSGILNKRNQNQKRMPHPCLVGGPKEGGNAVSPLHSRGSPTKRTKIRNCYLTLAFSGAQKRAEMPRHLCILGGSSTKGCKIRSGCLTLAFLGAQKRAEVLRHPCILRDPQQRGPKSEVAASPLPSRGPKRGRKCHVTSALWEDLQQRGPKSELAASPLPSWGPKRGRKCYVTPAFSGILNKRDQPCQALVRAQQPLLLVGFHHIPDWRLPVPGFHWAIIVLYYRRRRFEHAALDHSVLDQLLLRAYRALVRA